MLLAGREQGAYTGDEVNIILASSQNEEIEHIGIVHDIDPHAFLMMSEGR